MDDKNSNLYSTEIPVAEAEKEKVQAPSPTLAPPPLTIPTHTPGGFTPPALPSRYKASKSSPFPMIIVGILLLAIGFLSGYIIRGMGLPPSLTAMNETKTLPTPTQIPIPTATPIPADPNASTSADPSSNRFSSADLGILFDYAKVLPDSGGKTVGVEAVGTRVYVYPSGVKATDGQYVDVLSKLTTDTALSAVGKVIQNDPNFKNCKPALIAQTTYPATYQQVDPSCTSPIGVSHFFLTDSVHPEKLLYVRLGQYGINAGSDPSKLWQQTLLFSN